MSNAQRKLKRKKQKDSQRDLKEKIGLFDKIPNKCTMCEADFDKSDKEQVQSWRVAVREREGLVNLYCPDCWDNAVSMVKDIQEAIKGNTNEI